MRRALLLACAATTLAHAPAHAQEGGAEGEGDAPADITGAWSFYNTTDYDGDCRMSGTMTVRETPVANVYACELTAEETCQGHTTAAKQACYASRDGAALTINSAIQSVTGLRPGISYVPDDFILKILNESLMRGELRSADIAGMEFVRADGLVS